jgi:hypothetical protein
MRIWYPPYLFDTGLRVEVFTSMLRLPKVHCEVNYCLTESATQEEPFIDRTGHVLDGESLGSGSCSADVPNCRRALRCNGMWAPEQAIVAAARIAWL